MSSERPIELSIRHGLSDRTLERFLCGDLPSDQMEEIQRRVDGSAELARYLEERRREKFQFLNQYPFEPIRARVVRRSSRSGWRWGGLAVLSAASATLLLFALSIRTVETALEVESGFSRVRGGVKASLLVKRGEHVFEASQSVALRPKDRLRIRVEDPTGGYLFVLGLDHRGECTIHYGTEDAGGVLSMKPGSLLLPGSLEVDGEPTQEVLVILLSEAPLSRVALEEWASAGMKASGFPPAFPARAGLRHLVLPLLKDLP